jgi:nicotinamide riboside transporter PnuC
VVDQEGEKQMLWIVTALSLVGVVLNIYKKVACYWIWLATNVTWAIVNFSRGTPELGTLMSVYAALAVWGIIQWSRKG